MRCGRVLARLRPSQPAHEARPRQHADVHVVASDPGPLARDGDGFLEAAELVDQVVGACVGSCPHATAGNVAEAFHGHAAIGRCLAREVVEIGRASCRERV